jgi:hypothetical protein
MIVREAWRAQPSTKKPHPTLVTPDSQAGAAKTKPHLTPNQDGGVVDPRMVDRAQAYHKRLPDQ